MKGLAIDDTTGSVELDIREPAFYSDPYPYYDELRTRVPAFYWSDYGKWTFVRHQDVNAILRDRRFGRQISHVVDNDSGLQTEPRPELRRFHEIEERSLLQLEPPDHTRLRSLLQKSFVSRKIESLRPRIEELARGCCDQMEETIDSDGRCDLKAVFATPIPVTVMAELLGLETAMADQLLEWSHRMVKMYEPECTADNELAASDAADEFYRYLQECLPAKRRSPGDDLISQLIQVEENGQMLSEHELISNTILLMNAGHEATVNVIANGVLALLQHEERWREWRDSPEISPRAVEELLRYDTPNHIFDRFVLEDLEFAGLSLEQGMEVSLVLGAANRDPDVFEQPGQLLFDRQRNPHLSFGAGIHFCIGAPLARLELQAAMPILLSRFPDLELAEEPVFANSYHFRALQRLLVG